MHTWSLLCVIAVAGSTTLPSSGDYSDPNHLGCARTVSFPTSTTSTGEASVTGSDAAVADSPCDGVTDVAWGPLKASIDASNAIVVDFSSKGGPADLQGQV